MNHGSLFTGIGGFDYASECMGWENVFQVEWDKYCQKVLEKNFLGVKRYLDIRDFNGKKYKGHIDILTGGFPCQPFSSAGKRAGKEDNRYLWLEMLRVISEIKPPWVVGENVAGILTMENGKTFEGICSSLENEGYQVQPYIIPACGKGAWHRRNRIWIIANNEKKFNWEYNFQQTKRQTQEFRKSISGTNDSNTCVTGFEAGPELQNREKTRKSGQFCKGFNSGIWEFEPDVGRVAYGVWLMNNE